MTRLAPKVAIAVLTLVLVGCSSGESQNDNAPPPDHPAFADGTLTYDEYQAAFQAYRGCLSQEGFELIIGEEENQTVKFSVPAEAVDSGVDADCYDREFAEIDSAWQISRIDTSSSARILRACLEGLGIEPAESYSEMNQQLFDSGNDPTACSEYN